MNKKVENKKESKIVKAETTKPEKVEKKEKS